MGYKEDGNSATGFMVTEEKNWSKFTKQDFKLKPWEETDIDVAIDACGVCGSDVHTITGGWGEHPLPLCVGHEVIGRAVKVGKNVDWCKVGDRVGVGAQVGADYNCVNCKAGQENYCPNQIDTYGAPYEKLDGTISQGGYASHIRANQLFVFPIPDNLETNIAAPMMCAGLTVFSPLKRLGCGPGKVVGINGIGGLGHFAVLFAAALGAEVTAFSHSPSKKEDALKLGAKHFVSLQDEPDYFEKNAYKFDFILNSGKATDEKLKKFLGILKVMGTFHNVDMAEDPLPELHFQDFAANQAYIGTSHIGNRTEMLEMLDIVSKQNIKSWIQEIPISEAGCKEAVERVKNADNVRYRLCLTEFDKQFGVRA